MIEQYIYNKINANSELVNLIGEQLYAVKMPRGVEPERVVIFSQIGGMDGYPNIKSTIVQFNIYARKHKDIAIISQLLYDIFNEDNNNESADVGVVYSQRQGGELDIPTDLDDPNYYCRVVSYYFKLR